MRMLKSEEAARIVGFSRQKLYNMLKEGAFPAPSRCGFNVRWADYIVEAYTILYWRLDRPLPPLTDKEKAIITECIETAHSSIIA